MPFKYCFVRRCWCMIIDKLMNLMYSTNPKSHLYNASNCWRSTHISALALIYIVTIALVPGRKIICINVSFPISHAKSPLLPPITMIICMAEMCVSSAHRKIPMPARFFSKFCDYRSLGYYLHAGHLNLPLDRVQPVVCFPATTTSKMRWRVTPGAACPLSPTAAPMCAFCYLPPSFSFAPIKPSAMCWINLIFHYLLPCSKWLFLRFRLVGRHSRLPMRDCGRHPALRALWFDDQPL